MIDRSAIFSSDRIYRYTLNRIWIRRKPYCLFVCLNPSTADENYDDPTIRRCINYAESHGCGGMVMVNLFAYRSTAPDKLLRVEDPIGQENDFYIKKMDEDSGLTIVAWGSHRIVNGRVGDVLPLLKKPYCLKITSKGMPQHPLYLKKNLRAKPFSFAGG